MEYTQEQESPEAFHRWTGIAVLAATVARNIYLYRGYYTLYPNVYIVLVAGSAKCRKSVSSGIGIGLLKELKEKPMVFSQKITNEALIKALLDSKVENKCCGIIYASELSVFMGQDAIASGLIPTLTDLYDNHDRWSYHTRGRGEEILENVSLCMLGASTIDWLRTAIPADAVGGGFTSRVIFVYQERPRRAILFPKRAVGYQLLHKALLEDLDHMRNQKGPMELTPEAMEMAETWYNKEISAVHDSRLEGYFGRKHDTMFKLCMLVSMANGDERWITPEHVASALTLLSENEDSLTHIMSAVTSTDVGEKSDVVLTMIRKAGQMKHSELLKQCWRFGNAQELSQHIQTLIEAGEIRQELAEDRTTRVYIASKAW